MPASLSEFIEAARQRPGSAALELRRAMDDAFIPDAYRLTEMDRARFLDIIGKLIFTLEMDVRLNLVDALGARSLRTVEIEHHLADEQIEIVRPVLMAHSAIRAEALMSVAKTRLDEFQLADVLRHHHAGAPARRTLMPPDDVVDGLLRHADGPVARRAMEYLVAETRRTDRFDEPLVSRQDVPLALSETLHWQVAAVLRTAISQRFGLHDAQLDPALENAVGRALAQTDFSHGAQARAARLAQLLNEAGDVTDAFLLRCARQPRLLLLCACLAARGGLALSCVWPILLDRSLVSLTMLLRALDVAREPAADLLLLLADAHQFRGFASVVPVSVLLANFDAADSADVAALLHSWRRDPAFQNALHLLGSPHG